MRQLISLLNYLKLGFECHRAFDLFFLCLWGAELVFQDAWHLILPLWLLINFQVEHIELTKGLLCRLGVRGLHGLLWVIDDLLIQSLISWNLTAESLGVVVIEWTSRFVLHRALSFRCFLVLNIEGDIDRRFVNIFCQNIVCFASMRCLN